LLPIIDISGLRWKGIKLSTLGDEVKDEGHAMPCRNMLQQEVKVIWQKAPHGGPIPRLGVTPGGRKLYHW